MELGWNLVSKEIYSVLKLNTKEMNRRRFLLRKTSLKENEMRELEVLNTRSFLITSSEFIEFTKKYLK